MHMHMPTECLPVVSLSALLILLGYSHGSSSLGAWRPSYIFGSYIPASVVHIAADDRRHLAAADKHRARPELCCSRKGPVRSIAEELLH